MRSAGSRDARTLGALMGLGIANHVVLSGSRVTVSLDALSRGASAFTVGTLMALYALLPMLLAVPAGRFADRVGVRAPMRIGCLGLAAGAVLPLMLPTFPALFVSAALVGVSFMAFQIATQQATGTLGQPSDRPRNFSMLAMGYSISGFIGPLIAGLTIDQWGFRAAFALLAAIPVVPAVLLARGHPRIAPSHALASPAGQAGGVWILLQQPILRRVFAINALFAMGWDLHTIFVPIYGARLGLSASQIGAVLSTFAAATFVVRVLMPAIMRRRTEQQVLTAALFLAGAVYLAFPFTTSALTLATLSFVLGLGLGSGQPMVMSLLHTHAPPGRIGEAVGVRMSLVQTMSVVVPLLFGALGSSLGLAPVFWSVGLCLTTGGLLSCRR